VPRFVAGTPVLSVGAGRFIADAIYEIDHAISEPSVIVDVGTERRTDIPARTDYVDLLVPIFRQGELVYRVPQNKRVA